MPGTVAGRKYAIARIRSRTGQEVTVGDRAASGNGKQFGHVQGDKDDAALPKCSHHHDWNRGARFRIQRRPNTMFVLEILLCRTAMGLSSTIWTKRHQPRRRIAIPLDLQGLVFLRQCSGYRQRRKRESVSGRTMSVVRYPP